VIEMRELAVAGQGGNLEVHGSIAAVGVPVPVERRDQIAHRGDVGLVGGTRVLLGLLEAEQTGVLHERGDVLVGVGPQVQTGLLRTKNRTVVHIGEINHLADLISEQVAKRPPQHVDAHEGAEIPDMPARVHGQAAGIHADGVPVARREHFLGSGQRIEQTHRHDRSGMEWEIRKTRPPLDDTRISSVPL
jgi:hypothetical protein